MNRLARSLGVIAALAGAPSISRAADPAPLSAITDASAHTGAREKAVRRAWAAADAGEATRDDVREMLKKVAWARSTFYKVRLAALEELLADEPNLADTRNLFRLLLPTETQWQAIEFVGSVAADRGWTDLSTALVRCWSRPVVEPADDARPERRALERLHPQRPVEDVVFAVFAGEPGLAPESRGMADSRQREQQDAWALLRRLDTGGTRTVALLSQPGRDDEDPALATLRAAARDLGVIPDTAEQVDWITRLRTPAFAGAWSEAADAVARLSDDQRQGLAPRHLMGLRYAAGARPDLLSRSRDDLLADLERTLKPRKHHVRAASATAARRAPESLRTWRDDMCWADALLVTIAADAADDPALARLLFAQADEDKRDTSTEYGGVIDGAPSGFALRVFPPRPAQRHGDRRFTASPEMIAQGADSIFHYHLHCTAHDNADYAGPSDDDIHYAARQGRACLVFTFVSKDALNVDYYQSGGLTLDLGTVRRP